MEGQGWRGNVDLLDKIRRRITLWPALYEQTVDRKARVLSQSAKRDDDIFRFHDFNLMTFDLTTPASFSFTSFSLKRHACVVPCGVRHVNACSIMQGRKCSCARRLQALASHKTEVTNENTSSKRRR